MAGGVEESRLSGNPDRVGDFGSARFKVVSMKSRTALICSALGFPTMQNSASEYVRTFINKSLRENWRHLLASSSRAKKRSLGERCGAIGGGVAGSLMLVFVTR